MTFYALLKSKISIKSLSSSNPISFPLANGLHCNDFSMMPLSIYAIRCPFSESKKQVFPSLELEAIILGSYGHQEVERIPLLWMSKFKRTYLWDSKWDILEFINPTLTLLNSRCYHLKWERLSDLLGSKLYYKKHLVRHSIRSFIQLKDCS